MAYKPLSREQYEGLLSKGYGANEIISLEKQRKLKETPIPTILKENLVESLKKTGTAAKMMAQTGLFGLPEIASQKLTGKPFISAEEKSRFTPEETMRANLAGFTTLPAALTQKTAALTQRILPKATGLIPTMARGGITGAVATGTQLPTPEETPTLESALNDILGKAKKGFTVGALLSGLGYGVEKTRGYSANKVNAIKKGYKDWANKNYEAYDKGIKNLPKENINAGEGMQRFTQKLVKRNLINPDGTYNKPLTTSDAKLVKAYDKLYRKWAMSKGGKLNSTDIVDEYQAIKGKYSAKPTASQLEARATANEVMDSFKQDFKSGAFNKINAKYADFKNKEQLLEKYFDVRSKNPYLTGKGERTITSRLGVGSPTEIRTLKGITKEATGQTLKGGTALSTARNIARNPFLRYGAAATGAGLLGAKILRD